MFEKYKLTYGQFLKEVENFYNKDILKTFTEDKK